ncbi:hypothetical protein [Flavobacterium litorale]|uniref:Tetratricopeptide repeat protein n=1 Tax=Flavobacterium litorale TaxID=2856519 RepID=A0ABX8V3K8_9FLAO|nr:hypothetical protein [Flavobacterium litorale]QYJ67428.1 hypothetical protein K1I41_07620 [Flavobacterium litorale]
MKNFRIFILVLLTSTFTANACGFYPFGEDLRFCFFNPAYYGYTTYSEFDYSSHWFEDKDIFDAEHVNPNDAAWYNYCKGKVSIMSIRNAVYVINPNDFNSTSDNEMIHYLYATNDVEAINYLKFAKECEVVNTFYSDPWERNERAEVPIRNKFIKLALAKAEKTNSQTIKKRYVFLAIRLAFYHGDTGKIIQLYNTYFANSTNKDIVYYWSLYFRTLAEPDEALASYYAAQVFKHAPDKRFAVYTYFNHKMPIQNIVKFATTEEEKANVYLLAGIRRPDKALQQIKALYANEPASEGLDFLLLREVNKIEDWVYTPYYSLFTPSVSGYDDSYDESAEVVLSRVASDRAYAQKLLHFVAKANLKKVHNPQFWQMAKAQLEFITQKYTSCLATIQALEQLPNILPRHLKQLVKIKALAITAVQPYGSAIVKDAIKPILLENAADAHFLFAMGRELEYKGNTTDAAFLYSKIGETTDASSYNSYAFWKSKKRAGAVYYDYYSEWFSYVDAMYTPEQLKKVIDVVNGKQPSNTFNNWYYATLNEEKTRMYDLLGTKYIRQNKLESAISAFEMLGEPYWIKNYSLWERTDSEGNVFDENPFYDLKYTPEFIPVRDTIQANKYTVTKQLINYLAKAEDVKEKDRDYYYFLVANCYYNMTWYGNAWMMRRYGWSSVKNETVIEDEAEYYGCNLAKHYYKLAYNNAKTDKFKALCLRMAGRCERNWYNYQHRNDDNHISSDYTGKFHTTPNPYYDKLESENRDYYDDLMLSCTYFEDYFKARR